MILIWVIHFDLFRSIINDDRGIPLFGDHALVWILVSLIVKRLLDKRLGVQSFSDFNTELQMFLNEVLKLLGSHLLSLPLILDIVIVLDNFLTRFPVHLNHI